MKYLILTILLTLPLFTYAMDINDFYALPEYYNYEIEQHGGKIAVEDVRGSFKGIFIKLNDKIKQRAVNAREVFKGLRGAGYRNLRNQILDDFARDLAIEKPNRRITNQPIR